MKKIYLKKKQIITFSDKIPSLLWRHFNKRFDREGRGILLDRFDTGKEGTRYRDR